MIHDNAWNIFHVRLVYPLFAAESTKGSSSVVFSSVPALTMNKYDACHVLHIHTAMLRFQGLTQRQFSFFFFSGKESSQAQLVEV